MSNEKTINDVAEEVTADSYWIVANIFAIIYLLEEKFGAQATEQIVQVASKIEEAMRTEQNDEETKKEG
jgi:ribosomal protein L9